MANKRIMLIDDEVGFTSLVKLNLERTGHFAVCVVNNPLAALATARTFMPHLILLDVMMPDKTGGELLAEIEGDAQLKDVPVMFLTASTVGQVARAQHTAAHGRPVIAKPVDPKELIRHIDEVLGRSFFGLRLNWDK